MVDYRIDVDGPLEHQPCNHCEMMVINGIPVHEKGCPNDRDEEGEDEDEYRESGPDD
jgi:hypothetical protein